MEQSTGALSREDQMRYLLEDLQAFGELSPVQTLWRKTVGPYILQTLHIGISFQEVGVKLATEIAALQKVLELLAKYKVFGWNVAYAELLSLIEDPWYSLQRRTRHEDSRTQLQVVIPDPKALIHFQNTVHGEGRLILAEKLRTSEQLRERAENLREEVLSLDVFDLRDVDPIDGKGGIAGFKTGDNGIEKDLLLEFLGGDVISRYNLEVWSFDGFRCGTDTEFHEYTHLYLYPEEFQEQVSKLPGVLVSNECNAGLGACLVHRAKKPGSYFDLINPDMPGVAHFSF